MLMCDHTFILKKKKTITFLLAVCCCESLERARQRNQIDSNVSISQMSQEQRNQSRSPLSFPILPSPFPPSSLPFQRILMQKMFIQLRKGLRSSWEGVRLGNSEMSKNRKQQPLRLKPLGESGLPSLLFCGLPVSTSSQLSHPLAKYLQKPQQRGLGNVVPSNREQAQREGREYLRAKKQLKNPVQPFISCETLL